jgi:hypothetical protein
MNYGKEGAKAIDIPMLKSYWPAFGVTDTTPAADREKIAAKISPIMGNLKDVPPTLIVHGTADILVPIQQSERYVSALKVAGRTARSATGQRAWLAGDGIRPRTLYHLVWQVPPSKVRTLFRPAPGTNEGLVSLLVRGNRTCPFSADADVYKLYWIHGDVAG